MADETDRGMSGERVGDVLVQGQFSSILVSVRGRPDRHPPNRISLPSLTYPSACRTMLEWMAAYGSANRRASRNSPKAVASPGHSPFQLTGNQSLSQEGRPEMVPIQHTVLHPEIPGTDQKLIVNWNPSIRQADPHRTEPAPLHLHSARVHLHRVITPLCADLCFLELGGHGVTVDITTLMPTNPACTLPATDIVNFVSGMGSSKDSSVGEDEVFINKT